MTIKSVDDFLFAGRVGRNKLLAAGYVLLLFLAGFCFWIKFFNIGRIPAGFTDWRYFSQECRIIQEAFSGGVVPYHCSPEMYGTDRFLSLPHLVVSPQLLVLKYFDPGIYALVSVLLFYSLGFLGCMLLKKKYDLSLYAFSFLFLVFTFNGNIVSHLAVGHLPWIAYFLLPFFALFLLDYLERRDKQSLLKLSAVLALTVYQGGYHQFVWCCLFLLVLALTEPARWKDYLLVLGTSAALSFARLLPPFITYWDKKHEFLMGYPNLMVLLDSLVNVRDMTYKWIGPVFGGLRWHEYDSYIDVFGLGLIVYFGVAMIFLHPRIAAKNRFRELDLPLAAMTIFTLNYVYGLFRIFPVPLLNSERAPARFMILVIFVLAAVSAVRLDAWFREIRPGIKAKSLMAVGLLQMSFAMIIHAKAWSHPYIGEYLGETAFVAAPVASLLTRPDPPYFFSVKFSALVSLAALLIFAAQYVKAGRSIRAN